MSHFRSYVNQPDLVCLSSEDDSTQVTTGQFYQFNNTFNTPLLNAKKVALVRCSIPMAKVQIPDYCLYFWYYRLDDMDSTLSEENLHCIRFLPFGTQLPSGNTTNYAINKYISSYSDFIALLNQAAINDDTTSNPYFISNDITFSLTAGKQITVTGTSNNYFYVPAAYDDPLISYVLQNTNFTVPGKPFDVGRNVLNVKNQCLNLRVGFSQPYKFYNQVPSLTPVPGGTNGNVIVADSFPNLVYTNNIRLYSNLSGSAGVNSDGTKNFLGLVPVSTPPLGVNQYDTYQLVYLTKLPDTIYSIQIEMRDDQNQPFSLPDNAVVSVELMFNYD